MHKYKLLIGSAMLAVVSVLLQIYKIAYPWGGIIDIDAVGIPWVMAAFLFGLTGGIITSVVSTIGIAIFATTGAVGAVMKFLATIIVVLAVSLVGWKFKFSRKGLALAFVTALILRPVLMTLFNYYLGIPLFFNIPTDVALQQFPPELFIIPNAILAVTDFWIAYVLVFSTKLRDRVNVLK